MTSQDLPHPDAESILAAWLGQPDPDGKPDIEGLCREHPEHAPRLRQLFEQWRGVQGLLRQQGIGGSLAERLKSQYGSGVDPQVTLSLDTDPPTKGEFSSEVLERLAGRGPASTRYRLEGEVAHGGMGAILGVWDEDLRRHLAMKVMLGKGATAGTGDTPPVDPKMLARFLEEAQVTGQLDHPGIVPVHELGLDPEGRVYFTMKLVKGSTLKDVFDELAAGEGGWTQTRVLGLLLKVCEAMSYAHAKKVIHRDLKPANVMVGRFGEVYVMDWGLAKVLGREDEKDLRIQPEMQLTTSEVYSDRKDHAGETPDSPLYTMDGDVVGTPAYMPPEQARGDLGAMGPHSDVYGIGAMLYHLISGHMPYVPPGARLNNYAVWSHVQTGPPKSLHDVSPDTPAELVAICEKAMARDSADRYTDTAALAEDLSAYVEGRVVHAYETGAMAEARKWVRRNKPLAVSLAAALALVLGGTAIVAYMQNERRKSAEAVLQLSGLQDLKDLIAEADALWPPHPENIEPYRDWIEEAKELMTELPGHYAKRDELRALALQRGEEQRLAERRSHTEYRRIAALTSEIEAKRRALSLRRDGVGVAQQEVDWSAYPADASALNEVAWPLIDPERTAFGQELLGLALALLALELAGEDEELAATIGDTVAWAYAAVGRDAEAIAASRAALEAAPGARKTEFEGYLARIESLGAAAGTPEGLRSAETEIERRVGELLAVDGRVDERQDWRFPEEHSSARWWNEQLTKLIEGLEALQSGLLSPEAVTAEHGWSIAKRFAFAEDLKLGFAPGGPHAQAWDRSLPAIRAAYTGLHLRPQMGLVPIGQDPDSGLWEFAHLVTGTPARRGEDGKLELGEETGVVLVLLPGGTFWMGAQSSDSSGRNYDPQAQDYESPVHEVGLSPFLLSKYEMTQGQWERLTGRNPSSYQERSFGFTLLHPVEQVGWLDCMTWLPRVGLELPTEAQWEYGARAGTETPWWTGPERESLRGAANLADQAAAREGATWTGINEWPELDDGFASHAPVGSYTPSPFGLHDIHGNVWEWCMDWYNLNFYAGSPSKDPLAPWAGEGWPFRVNRGGGFTNAASTARSALRGRDSLSELDSFLGVRPARAIDR